ncbi:unnamed protein product [Vitrella brassicaformis CCMP3155]|uniref:Rhodanese domain-containing protein n=1 Tax=Vitrella brassicaformis (strain CCMP3155) TaxID=1169540 RepID=A0A0G4GNM4_VITBC|nr:unnamed protein product [Vitrella brassicaformis CCMP3155]|mmetsp:Transcript_53364/g.134378  ORF Transcript_53364/g.134378 Transcript_53364/m.134378 type:complete len:193 (-) Transcript_53364:711-1289(-)|eukprot:CEM31886.1 unnamed protein product [Vitrella brassicaformis CCMP3155]
MWSLTLVCLLCALICRSVCGSVYLASGNYSAIGNDWTRDCFDLVVDVRTLNEYDSGHVPEAPLVESLGSIRDPSLLKGCEAYKIGLYCQSGRRSAIAASFLSQEAGFQYIYDLGGMSQWIAAGLPVDDQPWSLLAPQMVDQSTETIKTCAARRMLQPTATNGSLPCAECQVTVKLTTCEAAEGHGSRLRRRA